MKVYKEYLLNYSIDVLTHEFIHQLFTQSDNIQELKKAWNYFRRKYKNEKFNTVIHIPVYAMHSHVILKYFGEEQLKREIEIISHLPNYKKSWDIVLDEGADNIIKEFRKRLI